jgi:hypothetical protein
MSAARARWVIGIGGGVMTVALLALAAWLCLPGWAPFFVVRWATSDDMVLRAIGADPYSWRVYRDVHGERQALAMLDAAFHHRSPRVRWGATIVVGRVFGLLEGARPIPPSLIEQVIARCEDPDPSVRRTAIVFLPHFDLRERTDPVLRAHLSDPDQVVREQAGTGLAAGAVCINNAVISGP